MKIRTHVPHTIDVTGTGLLSVAIVAAVLLVFCLLATLSGCDVPTSERGNVGGHVNDSCPTVICVAVRAVSR